MGPDFEKATPWGAQGAAHELMEEALGYSGWRGAGGHRLAQAAGWLAGEARAEPVGSRQPLRRKSEHPRGQEEK